LIFFGPNRQDGNPREGKCASDIFFGEKEEEVHLIFVWGGGSGNIDQVVD